jgi:acyl carrier protein
MSRPAATIDCLRTIIASKFEVDPQRLHGDTQLTDLDIDSLGVIEILFAVEEEFAITVPPEPADARIPFRTFDDLVRYIDRLVAEQHGANKDDKALP